VAKKYLNDPWSSVNRSRLRRNMHRLRLLKYAASNARDPEFKRVWLKHADSLRENCGRH
jgi:hypothetical protein